MTLTQYLSDASLMALAFTLLGIFTRMLWDARKER